MSKPHVFNILTEICWNCGISKQGMTDTQAMNDCPGPFKDEPVYLKARVNEKTMEVEVADHGIWIPLDAYRLRQRRLGESGVECSFYKPGDELPGAKYSLLEHIPESEVEQDHEHHVRLHQKLCASMENKTLTVEEKKNYCAPNEMFSRCKAGKTWKGQEKCRFAEKASFEERCMYFHTDGTKHCDNHKAQKALYLSAKDGRLVPTGG